jgi:hypothetical protein
MTSHRLKSWRRALQPGSSSRCSSSVRTPCQAYRHPASYADRHGIAKVWYVAVDSKGRWQLDDMAKLFLQYDYAETKDLCKDFLSLVAAILVFSITFSEKIVSRERDVAGTRQRLLAAWVAFIVSIVVCGGGLVLMSLAGGFATYGLGDYLRLASIAWVLILIAGSLFVLGLISLLVAAWRSMSGRPPGAALRSTPSPE